MGTEPTGTPARRLRLAGRLKALVTLGVLLALACGTILTPGAFEGPRRGITLAKDGHDYVLTITEDVKIEDFLRAVGRATGQALVWNPKDKSIQGKTIKGNVDLKAPPGKLFDLARALLTFYELVVIPVGPEGYQVQLVMDARQTSSILRLKPEYVKLTDENVNEYAHADGKFITSTLRVENMTNLRDARNALTRIVTSQNIGNVTEVPAANAFVVTDFAPNVVAIYRLLKEMDVKPKGRQLVSAFIQLEHAVSEELEPILTDLFTGRERITTRRPTVRRTTSSSGGVEEDPEPRIISDPRTNKIIVYGIRQDVEEIEKVIENLDVQIFQPNDRVHVVRLKNLEAQDTAEVLSSLIEAASVFGTSSGTTGPSGRRTGRPSTSGSQPSNPSEEEKPAVVADVKSNSLIIAASKRQFEELNRVIQEIDIKKDQVLIEAALIELTLDDSYRLAIELGLADDKGIVKKNAVSGFAFENFGQTTFADKNGDTFFTDRIPPFVNSDQTPAPSGLVGGIFAFGQVPLIFNIVNSIKQSRILQLPSLVTADNEEAFIEVTDEQAYTTSSTSNSGVTSGGLGGFEEAGTTLRISPHISDNHFLLLNINLTVSAFVGDPRQLSNGDVIPADKIRRTLVTAVTCPDRHTVVLGGLMGRNQRSTVDRTPYLADIPVLGEAFKSTSKSDRETSLFLFVTPTIMAGDSEGFDTLDVESCRRKQKADELIGYTEIYNANFVNCNLQDPASGAFAGRRPGAVRGSGSASDRFEKIGLFEATRFSGVSRARLAAEKAARQAALRGGTLPRTTAPRLPLRARPRGAVGGGDLPPSRSR
jgi:general secretion pathway protein D